MLVSDLIVVLAVILLVAAGAFVASRFSKPARETPDSVAGVIERFADGISRPYEWDAFTSVPIADPYLNDVRIACSDTHDVFPPTGGRGWASGEGIDVLRKLAADVREYERSGQPPRPPGSLLPNGGEGRRPGAEGGT